MEVRTMRTGILLLLYMIFFSVQAAPASEALKEDKSHVQIWNGFANSILELHGDISSKQGLRKEVASGGYAHDPDFFIEESYYLKDNGKLVSRICWEKDNPGKLHTIEVNVLDNKGRVVRDYSAAYLPEYRNAPVQTLINLHYYNGYLHSFRQFDAGGDLIYESCEGVYQGKDVQIHLDEDDLFGSADDEDQTMKTAVYKACFDGTSKRVGVYINPQ